MVPDMISYFANFRNDPSHPRDRINLPTEDENLVLETIVGGQDINIWAILMPAVYQLVPGSIIAKLWFNAIFPPINVEIVASTILNSEEMCFPGTGQCNTQPYDGISNLKVPQDSSESVFSNLMGKIRCCFINLIILHNVRHLSHSIASSVNISYINFAIPWPHLWIRYYAEL